MRRRRVIAGVVLAVIAALAFAGGTAFVQASSGRLTRVRALAPSPPETVQVSCRSPALSGRLPALVYLPAGYRTSRRRLPVIYFLHGLPASPTSYTQYAFVAAALPGGDRSAIVVAPQGARSPGSDREYLDWDAAEDWPQAIARDLTRCIDARYRTIAGRYGRALIGLSAGGYGALNIGLRNLSTFSAVESWSGYFAATDPAGLHILDLGSPGANAAATVPSGSALAGALARWPSLVAFYVGDQDSRFLGMNRQFDATLRSEGIAHVFRVYRGGHTVSLWAGRAPGWLGMALSYMSWEARHRGHRGARGR